MIIKTYSPYLFVVCAFGLFGFWAKHVTRIPNPVARTIASTEDCSDLVKILTSKTEAEDIDKIVASKLKINIWNMIVTPKEFDNFSDREYFKWLEIYKDPAKDLFLLHPVSIEQKLALIEVINAKYLTQTTEQNFSMKADIEKLGALRLRKLAHHLNHFDLKSKLTREDLDQFASDFMLILKGPPISLMDYFTNNKSIKAKERLARAVQEDVLLMGLRGVLNRIPEKNAYSKLEKGKYLIQRLYQYKIWKYLVLPYDLPFIERARIPDELLMKILADGLDAHEAELITHLKNQNMIDHYERFRKVYKPIAFSVGFYMYYKKFDGKMGENQEDEKKRLVEDMTQLSSSVLELSDIPAKTLKQEQDEHYKRLMGRYLEEYGTEPTPEEVDEIKKAIYSPS